MSQGWRYPVVYEEVITKFLQESSEVTIDTKQLYLVLTIDNEYEEFSINDLVLNFKEGTISFIEALTKANSNMVEGFSVPYEIFAQKHKLVWANTVTDQRLAWLLDEFGF